MDIVQEIEKASMHTRHPQIRPGDTVRVSFRVQEGEKSRIQIFEGVILRVRGEGLGRSFTVRKISFGVGVERVFPFFSPLVEGIQITQHAKVRRARLYYLRDLRGKAARLKGRAALASETTAEK